MAAQQPFHPVVAHFFPGGGGGGSVTTQWGFLKKKGQLLKCIWGPLVSIQGGEGVG